MFHYVDILSKKTVDMLLDGSRRASDDVRRDQGRWIDCGGAVVTEKDLEDIIDTIKGGDVKTWAGARKLLDGVRKMFVDRAAAYKKIEKIRHAVYSLAVLEDTDPEDIDTCIFDKPTESFFNAFLESVPEDCAKIAACTAQSRAKDYENPFRAATYESPEEMVNVLGPAADAVVAKTAAETGALAALAADIVNSIKSSASPPPPPPAQSSPSTA